ncbi:MAG: carboxymuconolactone decarboxylase family protein [Acidobacteriota bacterium]|jgi:4-carboxymuconolactone decarboxylase
MSELNGRERELVALGAAIGSNCVPCVEYHVPEASAAGLSWEQVEEAFRIADRVRRVPARKVLQAARAMIPDRSTPASRPARATCGCSESSRATEPSPAG